MRLCTGLILFVIFTQNGFAQDSGLVMTDGLLVRSAPGLQSTTVSVAGFGDMIRVYGTSGSGRLVNGVFDKWYKISATDGRWVNALYVNLFPFVVASTTKSDRGYFTVLNAISGFTEDGNKFLRLEDRASLNTVRDGEFVLRLMKSYDEGSIRLLDSAVNRLYVLTRSVVSSEALLDGIAEKNLRETSSWIKKYIFDGAEIDFAFMIDEPEVVRITDSRYLFEYGVQVGISKSELLLILGYPFSENAGVLKYVAADRGAGTNIEFYIENDRLSKIVLTKWR